MVMHGLQGCFNFERSIVQNPVQACARVTQCDHMATLFVNYLAMSNRIIFFA